MRLNKGLRLTRHLTATFLFVCSKALPPFKKEARRTNLSLGVRTNYIMIRLRLYSLSSTSYRILYNFSRASLYYKNFNRVFTVYLLLITKG